MERVILHVDMNCFYAGVEMMMNPALKKVPMAVGGDAEQRHGIILTANYIAKRQFGVKTGEALWQARQKCPDLVIVPPRYDLYWKISQMARNIYQQYTDQVEPFGLDECWLDITGSVQLAGDGWHVANELRQRVLRELGLTVSVGVSFNKIFAKLGSDYKKPDAQTVISRQNYKTVAWPLPVSDLLYVGSATQRKLERYAIHTIGDLARKEPEFLALKLGKMGYTLHAFANGFDNAPVRRLSDKDLIKSVGNGITAVRDMVTDEDVKLVCYILAESVAERLRELGCLTQVISVGWRESTTLGGGSRQKKLERPTALSGTICQTAMALLRTLPSWPLRLRQLHVRATDLLDADTAALQVSLFTDEVGVDRKYQLETTVDGLRRRFGRRCIQRAIVEKDRKLTGFDPRKFGYVHPVSYFK